MSEGGRAVDTVTRWLARGGPLPIDPLAERVLAATVEAALFGTSDPGVDLGRYKVERRVGQGGGGIVYRGFDPELGRPVAIKILHATRRDAARLRQEAEALARLSHPHVLEIYDVLAPSPDRVVLVTAWIDGYSLEDWLAEAPRDPSLILATFIAVGRGLAAVHAAGLVHRDVKPSNVLVAESPTGLADARTIVLADFGLAQPAAEAPTIELKDAHGSSTRVALGIVGTPGYMAPEQRIAQPETRAIDPRADQWSFCASLFEALCGMLPPSSPREAATRLRSVSVAARAKRAVLRGLSEDPERRFSGMHELLAALQPRRSRRGFALAGVIAMMSCTALAGMLAPTDGEDGCAQAAVRVETIWQANAPAVRDAFSATGTPYPADAFTRVDASLVRYGARWRTHALATCDTALAPDEQDRRRRCLEDRLWDVESLVGELERADPRLVERAASAVFGLSSPATCDAPDDIGLALWEPDDDDARAHATRLQQRLSEARASSLAGRYAASLAITTLVVQEAERLHLEPIALVARIDDGRTRVLAGELREGRDALAEAYWLAIAGGHDVEAARAASALGFTEGYKLADPVAGWAWSRHAEAALDRLDAHDERRAELWSHLGSIEAKAGRYAAARQWHMRALEIRERLASDRPDHLASTLNNLGNVDVELGDFASARTHHERALQLRRESLGEHHPHVATSLNNLGSALFLAGESADARVAFAQALAVWEAILGTEHVDLLGVLHNSAMLALEGHDVALAQTHARRAVAIAEAQLPAGHPQLALALSAIALVQLERGEPNAALASFERAHRIALDAHGPAHHDVGSAKNGVGLALRELGRYPEAKAAFAEGHSILSAALGEDHHLAESAAKHLQRERERER